MFTETQLKVILILLDDRGHAGWELAGHLEREQGNIHYILKELEKDGIISQGVARISTRKLGEDGVLRCGKEKEIRKRKKRRGIYNLTSP